MFYHMISDEYRIPVVNKAHVKMDTRLCCLEKAEDVKTSHVLAVTIPGRKGKRLEIPVQASWDVLRRMAQYKVSGSMRYTITAGGFLKLTCSLRRRRRHQRNIPKSSVWMLVSLTLSILQMVKPLKVSSLPLIFIKQKWSQVLESFLLYGTGNSNYVDS